MYMYIVFSSLHFHCLKKRFFSSEVQNHTFLFSSSMQMQHHLDILYLKILHMETLSCLFYQDLRVTNDEDNTC